MVGHFLLETQPNEAPKAQPIAERLFQLRVRQRVPLLQQQRAQHQQRPVRRTAFARRVNRAQQLLDSAPVQKRADALQPLVLSLAPSHHRIRQAHLLALAPPHPRPRLPRTYLLIIVALVMQSSPERERSTRYTRRVRVRIPNSAPFFFCVILSEAKDLDG